MREDLVSFIPEMLLWLVSSTVSCWATCSLIYPGEQEQHHYPRVELVKIKL